ncbi:unnamed protein product [Heligmosomoides polygyrus]|uniref:Uncharacterized protein n=1 Tax=Heligmosomoides polygyrus TaxID=6339 RepID=A0A3P8EVE1_HELPZ|nr:unnamed protein product [Heligmosomoides polygyrus]
MEADNDNEERATESPSASAITAEVETMRGVEQAESSSNVQRLVEQMHSLGRPTHPLIAEEAPAIANMLGADFAMARLKDTDPHVLITYAQQKLRKEAGPNRTYCDHSSASSSFSPHASTPVEHMRHYGIDQSGAAPPFDSIDRAPSSVFAILIDDADDAQWGQQSYIARQKLATCAQSRGNDYGFRRRFKILVRSAMAGRDAEQNGSGRIRLPSVGHPQKARMMPYGPTLSPGKQLRYDGTTERLQELSLAVDETKNEFE